MGKKSKGNLWPEGARAELLHIFPQTLWHGPARIVGSHEALNRLGKALVQASNKPEGKKSQIGMMASDGESYSVEICPMSDKQIDDGPLPYSTLGVMLDSGKGE